jgi:CheY-like chemotaxis protein
MKSGDAILLVEDDPTDVFLLQRTFADVGITQELRVMKDGVEAVDFLVQAEADCRLASKPLPCLMVLDLKLPLKSGLEVLSWMRGQNTIKRIPVIVFTSSLDRGDINGAYDRGACGYFLKTGSLVKMRELVTIWRDCWLIHGQLPLGADQV